MTATTILVAGGAGYIGSHMVKLLCDRGLRVIVVDNLVTGHQEMVDARATFIKADIGDKNAMTKIFSAQKVDAVFHFCAFCYVGESVTDPRKYYANNIGNGLILLESMLTAEVKKLIFSSSCATYGDPQYQPMDELHQQKPINPYGQTKLIFEQILKDYDQAYGLRHINLRYFNASGADPEGKIGEKHAPETHLIPLIISAALSGGEIKIFGNDYDTPDGTCIRDYIHILDLANAHLQALEYLEKADRSDAFNLGIGNGYSVREVIKVVEKITGRNINSVDVPRRAGDPARLIANARKANDLLGWKPQYKTLESIVETAYQWHKKN